MCHVDIANSIVYLVQIFRIIVRSRHASEFTNHLAAIVAGGNLGLCDAGIELQFVGRMTSRHFAKGAIGLVAIAQ